MIIINGPQWFGKFDVLFAFLYALAALMIAGLGYRIYKVTEEKKYHYLCLSFFIVAIANFLYAFFSGALYTHIYAPLIFTLEKFDYAFIIYELLTLLAFTILLIMSIGLEKKAGLLVTALVLLHALFSYQYYIKFHLVMFVLLAFLTWQFYSNYKVKKKNTSKLVFLGFYLFMAAEIFYLGLVISPYFYVFASIIRLLGAISLFSMLYKVRGK